MLGNQCLMLWGWCQGAMGSLEEVMREGTSAQRGPPRPLRGQEEVGCPWGELEKSWGLKSTSGLERWEEARREQRQVGEGLWPSTSAKHALHTHCHLPMMHSPAQSPHLLSLDTLPTLPPQCYPHYLPPGHSRKASSTQTPCSWLWTSQP